MRPTSYKPVADVVEQATGSFFALLVLAVEREDDDQDYQKEDNAANHGDSLDAPQDCKSFAVPGF